MKVTAKSRKLFHQVLKWHNAKFDKLTGIKEVNGKLKLFTPEAKEIIKLKPVINHKQKKVINSIKKAILHLNLLSLLIVFSCGDDIMDTGNPSVVSNDSLKLSLDSFSLYGSGLVIRDTNFFNAFSTGDSVKMTFTAETNCTGSDSSQVNAGCGNIFVSLINPNTSVTYYGSYVNFSSFLGVGIKSSTVKYIRIKNFKLYKVNPV